MAVPILWSFRRCPYAMRARLALAYSGQAVELREVVLRDKPDAFLATSPSATVPCLKTQSTVLDESLDIMTWALGNHDPDGWMDMPSEAFDLISENDGPFKTALDRYKYATRYADADQNLERETASAFVRKLDQKLEGKDWLLGERPRLVDMALLPFVRQFAHTDFEWFDTQPWPNASRWLQGFKSSQSFAAIMEKYPQWHPDAPGIPFPSVS